MATRKEHSKYWHGIQSEIEDALRAIAPAADPRRRPGCRAVMVRGEELEALFLVHLRWPQPTEDTLAEFPRITEQVWDRRQGDAVVAAKEAAEPT